MSNFLTGYKHVENVACAFAIYIRNCTGKFNVAAFQHFLQAIQLPVLFSNKTLSVRNKLTQFSLRFDGNETAAKQTVLEKIGNPFGIIGIGLSARYSFHMSGIDNHGFKISRFKNVVQWLPVGCRTFHGDHLAIVLNQPIRQTKEFFGGRSEFSKFLFSAAPKTGNNDFLVYINTTTTLIDSIHEITSWYKLQRDSLT